MNGFIFRMATAIKEFGERHRLSCLIRLGLTMKEWVFHFQVQ
jgi:hypothetical protein